MKAEVFQNFVYSFEKVISFAETSLSDAVKKAKNELKNTLSNPCAAILLKYDRIEFAEDGHGVQRAIQSARTGAGISLVKSSLHIL